MSDNNKMLRAMSPHQREYWLNSNNRWNIKSGATRSGKTFLDYYMIPRRIRETKNQGLIVILGNTRGTLQRNIIDPMKDIWGSELVSDIASDNTSRMFGKKVYVLGADNKRRVEKIQGAGIEYCYGDEVTTWDKEVFSMLQSRLDKPNSLFDGTCNPDGPDHWLKKFLDSDADIYHQHYTIDDNPFLTPKFVSELKKEYAGKVEYDRYIRGLWVRAEGLIYKEFSDHSDEFMVDACSVPPLSQISIGVDFGGNKSKHSFVATGITHDYRDLYVLASERHETNLDPQGLAEKYVDFLIKVEELFGRVHYTYTDNAEQVLPKGFETELRRRGLRRVVRDCKKVRILDRIKITQKLVANRRIFYTEYALSVKSALEDALWNEKVTNKTERLDNGSTDIDTLDAFEYSFERDIKRLNAYEGG